MPLSPKKTDLSLQVRRIKQDKDMSCWYASAQMVLAYRNVVMSVVNMSTNLSTLIRYLADKGLAANGVRAFADEVGLHKDQSHFSSGFNENTYGNLIGKLGPLWMPGLFPQGGHVVVVVGIAGDKLMIADPDGDQPFPRWMAVGELEAIRTQLSLPVLYRLNAPAR